MTDICMVGDRPGAITFIAWDRAAALELIRVKLLGSDKTDTSCGLEGPEDVMGAGTAYVAFQDDIPLVLVVLVRNCLANGFELEIRAAVALSGRPDATELVLPVIERAFGYDCQMVSLYTRRAGLVRKLERAGYSEAAKIMRKKINV